MSSNPVYIQFIVDNIECLNDRQLEDIMKKVYNLLPRAIKAKHDKTIGQIIQEQTQLRTSGKLMTPVK